MNTEQIGNTLKALGGRVAGRDEAGLENESERVPARGRRLSGRQTDRDTLDMLRPRQRGGQAFNANDGLPGK